MLLEQALDLVTNASAEELRSLTRDELIFITGGMSPEDAQTFFFEKNIKVFGGINEYVNDFFAKGTVEHMKTLPNQQRLGAIALLTKISTKQGLTQQNKQRVDAAIGQLSRNAKAAAPAARRRKTLRKRSRTNRR